MKNFAFTTFGFRTLLLAQLSFSLAALAAEPSSPPENKRDVTVMTRNLYVGSSFASLLEATSLAQVPLAMAKSYADALLSDVPSRAGAWAEEIAQAAPDLVGLQEAVLFRIQYPGDFLAGNPVPATTVRIDFVRLLLDALAARGAHYQIVAALDGFDLELPSITGDDIRVTDRDVILARTDLPPGHLTVLGSQGSSFATSLEIPVPGGQRITFKRGWVSVDVLMNGHVFRFLNTHLERLSSAVRFAQAQELLSGPANTNLALIFAGDFNADAVLPENTYSALLSAGFTDVWTATQPLLPGLTCCQRADLRNPLPTLSERIDLILVRGDRFEPVEAKLVGEDLLPSGVWPSDHAGLLARIKIR
jgi:endonuclease/exonuclease/phosphatase family metal-dependent hydrolase